MTIPILRTPVEPIRIRIIRRVLEAMERGSVLPPKAQIAQDVGCSPYTVWACLTALGDRIQYQPAANGRVYVHEMRLCAEDARRLLG